MTLYHSLPFPLLLSKLFQTYYITIGNIFGKAIKLFCNIFADDNINKIEIYKRKGQLIADGKAVTRSERGKDLVELKELEYVDSLS